MELDQSIDAVRAKRPLRIPVVLTREEVAKVLQAQLCHASARRRV